MQSTAPGNCAALTRPGGFSAYLFNLFTMVFDLTTLGVSSYYLWLYSKPTTSNRCVTKYAPCDVTNKRSIVCPNCSECNVKLPTALHPD